MRAVLGVFAGLIAFVASAPYSRDIVRYRVQRASSTRLMLFFLVALGLLQSHSIGSTWSLFLLVGEVALSAVLLPLAIKYGLGGMAKLDIICYSLLVVDVTFWLTTDNTQMALVLTITADIIATIPTIIKTYKFPNSETPLFHGLGTIAALLAILAEPQFIFVTVMFPIYLFFTNGLITWLSLRKPSKHLEPVEEISLYIN